VNEKPSALVPVDGLIETYVPKRNCQNCAAMRDGGCSKAPDDNAPCADFVWGYTIEEYETDGIGLLDYVQQAAIGLGMLLDWGNEHIRPHVLVNGKPIHGDSAWCSWCAKLWNTSRPTLVKAWNLWKQGPKAGVEIPANVCHSAAYAIISAGIEDPNERQRVLDRAADEQWTAWDVREIKGLLKRGLVDDWELPQLVRRGDYVLARKGKRYRRVARIMAKAPKAGVWLLLSRGRVHREEKS
jgi:hypothetical protein